LTKRSASDHGLHAAIFAKDIDRALFLGRRIPSGIVLINVTPL